jgi:hypothetical protein
VFLAGAVWLTLRVVYWNGYYAEDAPGYVSDAVWLALGEYAPRRYVNGLNVGTYAPVALPLVAFGKSEAGLSLWPLCCSLLGVVSVGGATGMLFGRAFGLLAAFLYATYPGDVFFSTVVMPDAIQAGWLSFSLFLVVLAYSPSVERRHLVLAAGGLAMGMCHLIRGNGAFLVPVGVVATAVLSRLVVRQAGAATARACLSYLWGWVFVHILEGAFYFGAANDFAFRLRVIDSHYGALASIAQWGLNDDPRTIPYSVFPPLLWFRIGDWWRLNQDQAYHALLFWWAFVLALLALAVWRLRKKSISDTALAGFIIASFWFAWPLLYHQFGSQSLTQFVPMHRLSRHLVVYAPGAIVLSTAACFLITQAIDGRRGAKRALATMACAFGFVHLYFCYQGQQIAHGSYQRIKETYLRIREHLPDETRTIVADPGDLAYFDFWLNPLGEERVKMRAFSNFSSCEDLTEGVVLTYSNPGWTGLSASVIRETVQRLPCLLSPPPRWKLLYGSHAEKIYVVEAEDASIP